LRVAGCREKYFREPAFLSVNAVAEGGAAESCKHLQWIDRFWLGCLCVFGPNFFVETVCPVNRLCLRPGMMNEITTIVTKKEHQEHLARNLHLHEAATGIFRDLVSAGLQKSKTGGEQQDKSLQRQNTDCGSGNKVL
jgi:hypothetical protein